MHESVLLGGRSAAAVVRVGNEVHRSPGPRPEFTRGLLQHLEREGFTGAPRYRGMDTDGRLVVEYIDGWVPHETVEWSSEQLAALARLVRGFHDATAGSVLADGQETVCHNDIGPWNVVVRDGMPVALIDFDDAAPGPRLDDTGYLVWTYLRVGDEVAAEALAERIRFVLGEYGSPTDGILDAVAAQQARVLAELEAMLGEAAAERRDWVLGRIAAIKAEVAWLVSHRGRLEELLGAE